MTDASWGYLAGHAPWYSENCPERAGVYLGTSPEAFAPLSAPGYRDVYLTSHLETASEVLRRALLWALPRSVPTAFVRSMRGLRWINSREAPWSCAGRFVVLRPGSGAAAELTALRRSLRDLRGPLAMGLVPFSPGSVLHRAAARDETGAAEVIRRESVRLGIEPGRLVTESATGAVAEGVDLADGRQVMVKLSRRGVYADLSGTTEVTVLRRHDHAFRAHVGDEFSFPRALAHIDAEEGAVTVEEYIDGIPLVLLIDRRNPLHVTGRARPSPGPYVRLVCRILTPILGLLGRMHARGVTHGDLTPANIMVRQGSAEPVLIDFEYASAAAGKRPAEGRTSGFAPTWAPDSGEAAKSADLYSFGRTVLAALVPVQNLGELDHDVMISTFRSAAGMLGIPPGMRDSMADMWRQERPDDNIRAAWKTILARLQAHFSGTNQVVAGVRLSPSIPPAREFAERITAGVAVGGSLGHGATGILYALRRCGFRVPLEWVESTLAQLPPPAARPGLRDGALGAVWALRDFVGPQRVRPERLREVVAGHRALRRSPGLLAEFAALRLRLEGGDEARPLFDQLCAVEPGPALARQGVSIAAGLLLAHDRLAEARYLEAGFRWAAWLLEDALGSAGRTSLSLLDGAAGVLATAVRCAVLREDNMLLRSCYELGTGLSRCHPLAVGVDGGLAGIGLALADCRDISGDGRYDRLLTQVAANLLEMVVPTARGPAFPGPELRHLSDDYGGGTAGALLLIARLSTEVPWQRLTHPFLSKDDDGPVFARASSKIDPPPLSHSEQGTGY